MPTNSQMKKVEGKNVTNLPILFQNKGEIRKKNYVHLILDWLQSLKQFFINVLYHTLVASLTLMALS